MLLKMTGQKELSMIDKIKKQLEEFHKELSEAFENGEKMDQLYATNITITMGSQTFELPFAPDTVEIVAEALLQYIHDSESEA